ncbi:MAG: GNAT family N-acetyltransferase [Eubacteriales bacterium]|nr:GNAT family N-acetyltransferase [Eubacteriales bacterium]MDD4476307.1 GNAT family N-acetyltransferase [Eubacteriales bacterium]
MPNNDLIYLNPEVTRCDAAALSTWMRDNEVTEFLTDNHTAAKDIDQLLDTVSLPALTFFFNRDGRFYMIHDGNLKPVGFIRLAEKAGMKSTAEIVVAIGDKNSRGKKKGTQIIKQALSLVFFELRLEKVIAKIHPENLRSVRAFMRAGFRPDNKRNALIEYSMTLSDFLGKAKNTKDSLYVTELDRERLKGLINSFIESHGKVTRDLCELDIELNRAKVIEPAKVPDKTVTMNSCVELSYEGKELTVSLVYPEGGDDTEFNPDAEDGKISVLSTIGTAILGYSEGDSVDWETSERTIEIEIKRLVYQPEASGHFHL